MSDQTPEPTIYSISAEEAERLRSALHTLVRLSKNNDCGEDQNQPEQWHDAWEDARRALGEPEEPDL